MKCVACGYNQKEPFVTLAVGPDGDNVVLHICPKCGKEILK
jgi:predicted RNA-binding Zn-ribbon protein involved in translation (DUF1610 family)